MPKEKIAKKKDVEKKKTTSPKKDSKSSVKVKVISEKKEKVHYKDLSPANLERALIPQRRDVSLNQAAIIEENSQMISLEQSVENVPLSIPSQGEDFKYLGTAEQGEVKYLSDNSPTGPKRIDLETLGREKEKIRNAAFIHSESFGEQVGVGTYLPPERVEKENLGKEEFKREFGEVKRMDYEPVH